MDKLIVCVDHLLFLRIGNENHHQQKDFDRFFSDSDIHYSQASYRLARKNAFLETSNLSSAFQRMTQEPHSKQKNLNKIYELVELNHNFLSSLASLSIYIQHHTTTEASERFNSIVFKIDENLGLVIQALSNSIAIGDEPNFEEVGSFEKQLPKFESENVNLNAADNSTLKRNHQEEQLIWEQLRWLYSLSSTMMKLTSSL
jgi:uncharacterized membrane protein YccC